VADPPPTRPNLIWVMPAEGDVTDTCLVLAGGEAVLPADPLPHDIVIAADGGLALAERLGLAVDVLVGDLDSAEAAAVDRAKASGADIEQHPVDKDASDLELALEAAAGRGCTRVVVVGGTSLDRIDHLLANAALLAAPRFAAIDLQWWVGATRVLPVHGSLLIEGEPGEVVSILPIGGPATVTATGLVWPLDHERLDPHSTRSISNRLDAATATITVSDGRAIVTHTRGTT
jgi:thiamine pyrophosphokinase